MISGREGAADTSSIPPEDPAKLRFLKAVVVILGIMLATAFLFLMGLIAMKVFGDHDRPSPPPVSHPILAIAPGARVTDMRLSDRRLAVRITTLDDMEEILLFDARDGRLLARIRLAPAR